MGAIQHGDYLYSVKSCDLRIQDWQLAQVPGTPTSYLMHSCKQRPDSEQDSFRTGLDIAMLKGRPLLGLTNAGYHANYHIS